MAVAKRKTHSLRKVTERAPRFNAKLHAHALAMLSEAEAVMKQAEGLDTAVRDVVHEGLAFIVYAAYDTEACAQCISSSDFVEFIQQRTYEWFRKKGFAEWFCVGCSTLFKTTPRIFYRTRTSKVKGGFKMERVELQA